MNYVQNANQLLSKLYLEGGAYTFEEIGRTFGMLECILDDADDTPETNIARECAAMCEELLAGDDVDMEMLEQRFAAISRGFARYKALCC